MLLLCPLCRWRNQGSEISEPMRGRAGIWSQGYILSTALIPSRAFRESGGAVMGEEGQTHSFFGVLSLSCSWDLRDKRWVWMLGRKSYKRKELVSGSLHSKLCIFKLALSVGFLVGNSSGSSARPLLSVCVWFARPIFKTCTQGFLFSRSRLLSLHVCPHCCLHFSKGAFAACCPVAGCQGVPLRGIRLLSTGWNKYS